MISLKFPVLIAFRIFIVFAMFQLNRILPISIIAWKFASEILIIVLLLTINNSVL